MHNGWYAATVGALTFASMMAFRLRREGRAHLPQALWLFNVAAWMSSSYIILGVVGFFLVSWYVPILTILAGTFAVHFVPDRVALTRGPVIVYLAWITGSVLFVSTWHWGWRLPGV